MKQYNFLFQLNFIILSLLFFSCNAQSAKEWEVMRNYSKGRSEFQTKLLIKDKAPQGYNDFEPVYESIKLINYPSGAYKHKALLDTTNIRPDTVSPVIVYLHGGFALGYGDVEDCEVFKDAGYIVFAPSYRGENGNDGNFELFLGELDDVKASIEWLIQQPYVDTNQIYVFGHSIGGGMALLSSFYDDMHINESASSAGLYDISTIEYWEKEDQVPYNTKNKIESLLRLPVYSLEQMARNHMMYIGTDDYYKENWDFYKELYPKDDTKLLFKEVEGDHFSSLYLAMEAFLKKIKSESK